MSDLDLLVDGKMGGAGGGTSLACIPKVIYIDIMHQKNGPKYFKLVKNNITFVMMI